MDGAIDPVAAYACKHGCRRRRDRLRLQVAALAWRQVSAVVERKNELQSARRRRCHDDKVTFRKTNSSPLAGGDAVTTKSHFAKRTRGRNRRALPGVAAESHFAKRVREDRCRVLPGVAAESHFAKRVRGDRCRGLPGVAAESHFATADQRRTPSDLDATRARNAGEFVNHLYFQIPPCETFDGGRPAPPNAGRVRRLRGFSPPPRGRPRPAARRHAPPW